MALAAQMDLKGTTALLIGQGPSAWELDPRGIKRFRDAHGLLVCACNRGWEDWSCDLLFSMETKLVGEFVEARGYEQATLVCPVSALQDYVMTGHAYPQGLFDGSNYFHCNHIPGLSTGAQAFSVLLNCGVTTLFLAGFDGETDTRNRYTGTPHYRNRVTLPAAYVKWGTYMRQQLQQVEAFTGIPRRVEFALVKDRAHSLDKVAKRVAVQDLLRHIEETVCAPAQGT